MRQVRQVLGPDALIVSNRSVDGGIEVLATVDGAFDEAAGQAQQPPQQHASQQAPQPATHHAPYQEQTPAVMPPTAYPAPSRPIAAYQSAYAASALPEDEDEAGMMPASAPAAPVRVEIPPLPSAAPVRMEMRALGASRAGAHGNAAIAGGAPGPRARHARGAASGASRLRGLRRRSSSPCRSNTPRAAAGDAARVSGRAASLRTTGRATRGQAAGRARCAGRAHARGSARAATARRADAAGSPPPAAPMARMPDAPMPQGLALPPGTLPPRPPACRMRSAPCAARWKAAWTACSGRPPGRPRAGRRGAVP